MIFFSDIRRAQIVDIAGEAVGKVKDVVIKLEGISEFPPVYGVVIDSLKGEEKLVRAEHIEEWAEKRLYLSIKWAEAKITVPQGDEYVQLRKSVLDKQIVDLSGMRVVRVNDLQLARVRGLMSLVAIDVSTRALLRRLGLTHLSIFNFLKRNLLEWKDVRLADNRLQLSTGAKELIKLHPADIANIIEKLNVSQGSLLLQSLDQTTAARVLEEIQPDIKKMMVRILGAERAATIMGKMSVDELVDLIQLLPSRESREILNKLTINGKIQKVKKILEYDEETAGGLMTTEFVTAHPAATVAEVIKEIRRISHFYYSILFIYITDEEGKFFGVVSMRNLIVANHVQIMKDIMSRLKETPTVTPHQNLTHVAKMMTKYNLYSVAVVDKDKRLLGVITVDDVMRRLVPEA